LRESSTKPPIANFDIDKPKTNKQTNKQTNKIHNIQTKLFLSGGNLNTINKQTKKAHEETK